MTLIAKRIFAAASFGLVTVQACHADGVSTLNLPWQRSPTPLQDGNKR
jgi:hypothetical protein